MAGLTKGTDLIIASNKTLITTYIEGKKAGAILSLSNRPNRILLNSKAVFDTEREAIINMEKIVDYCIKMAPELRQGIAEIFQEK